MASLQQQVAEFLRQASEHIVLDPNDENIKTATDNLRALMKQWVTYDKLVRTQISTLIGLACSHCKHPNARRGHNERDGSWMATCPVCGATE